VKVTRRESAYLALEDGTVFRGLALGARARTEGELVFNTSHSGYQEILTDPSYCRQIVVMSFPPMGNYSFRSEDLESGGVQVAGFVVADSASVTSPSGGAITLDEYLAEANVVGIEGVDTRAIVRRVRTVGAMRAVIASGESDPKALVEAARAAAAMEGANLVDVVAGGDRAPRVVNAEGRIPIALMDFGVKQGIVDSLARRNCRVTVFPAHAKAADVLASKPAGVLLSNGPGDPAALPGIVAEVRQLLGKTPVFGICLGHQLLAIAAGGKTYKLPFGHRGGNHPVIDLTSNAIAITSQNHGFAVDEASLPSNVEATERNLYDGTNEGIRLRDVPAFSVQYHPEARPGPLESGERFERFLGMLK
jgi:carbamoyl-phosphate synthase small subunit